MTRRRFLQWVAGLVGVLAIGGGKRDAVKAKPFIVKEKPEMGNMIEHPLASYHSVRFTGVNLLISSDNGATWSCISGTVDQPPSVVIPAGKTFLVDTEQLDWYSSDMRPDPQNPSFLMGEVKQWLTRSSRL